MRYPVFIRLAFFFLFLCPHFLFTSHGHAQHSNARPIAFINGTLIDGTGGAPVKNGRIVFRNGEIIAVGSAAEILIPRNARIIDVEGAAILPGFVNAHVHTGLDPKSLRDWIWAGVTTLRDLGYPGEIHIYFHYRDLVNQDPLLPNLVGAGPVVTVPDGYPIAIRNYPGVTVTSPEDAEMQINALLDLGANVIKVALEDLGGIPTLSKEELKAIVQTAHARGIPVSAHVTKTDLLKRALEAGVDDANHMVQDRLPDSVIVRMVDAGMILVPTLHPTSGNYPDIRKIQIGNLRRFVQAGGIVALGDDAASSHDSIGMPIREMELMQEAGMTPMQIIVAGTRNGAMVCRLLDTVGTLEPGKQADFIVVAGNPLENFAVLNELLWVVHKGAIVRSPETPNL